MNDFIIFNKNDVIVNFSLDDFKNHQGIHGLKYYLIIMYLRKYTTTFGNVHFTLNHLVKESGYSPDTHHKEPFRDFRQILYFNIILPGYASTEQDIEKIKGKELIVLRLSDKKDIFFSKGPFVQLSISEYEEILSINSNVGKSSLIGVYLYIKQFIQSNDPGGLSYPTREQIAKNLGIAESTVDAAISSLEAAKMLYVARDMFVENENSPGTFVPIRNVYALRPEALNSDVLAREMEKIYMRPVYKKNEIEGKIIYFPKRKD